MARSYSSTPLKSSETHFLAISKGMKENSLGICFRYLTFSCGGNSTSQKRFESERYKQYLQTLKIIRDSRCVHCDSNCVCGGVNINIAYLYVEELPLIDYSCMQCNMIIQRILSINDQIINDFRNGCSDIYNSYVQSIYSKQ